MAQIRVVVTDDHPIVRAGIRYLLEKAPDIVVVGEAGDGPGALRLVRELAPDVLLLDLEMPGMAGVEVARHLQAVRSPVRVLAWSRYDNQHYIFGTLKAGAAGYLTKEVALETIVEAVRGVAHGEEGWLSRRATAQVAAWTRKEGRDRLALTGREVEVLRLVARGWTNDRTANALAISERTVRFHLTNIYDKLRLRTRGEVIAWAVREGFGA